MLWIAVATVGIALLVGSTPRLTVPATAAAYPLWLNVLRRLPMEISMLQSAGSPLVATALGVAFLGGVVTPLGGVGVALVLVAARSVVLASKAGQFAPAVSESPPRRARWRAMT